MEATPSNPYSAPVSNPYGAGSGSADSVSPSTIQALLGTKGWVRFMSVMVWIGIGFMLIGAGFIGIASVIGLSGAGGNSPFGGAEMIALAGIYGLMAVLYVYPAIKLWAYASRITALAATRTVADLDAALTEQRRFWKFTGILFIVLICAYIVLFIGLFAVAGAAAFKSGGFPG